MQPPDRIGKRLLRFRCKKKKILYPAILTLTFVRPGRCWMLSSSCVTSPLPWRRDPGCSSFLVFGRFSLTGSSMWVYSREVRTGDVRERGWHAYLWNVKRLEGPKNRRGHSRQMQNTWRGHANMTFVFAISTHTRLYLMRLDSFRRNMEMSSWGRKA